MSSRHRTFVRGLFLAVLAALSVSIAAVSLGSLGSAMPQDYPYVIPQE